MTHATQKPQSEAPFSFTRRLCLQLPILLLSDCSGGGGSGGGDGNVKSLVSINVSPSNLLITTGTSQQLSATGSYSDGTTGDITSMVAWKCSNPAVATINSSGVVDAITYGTCSITASFGSIDATTTLFASQHYQLGNIQLDASAPILVGESAGRFWFPMFFETGNSQIVVGVSTTFDGPQALWPGTILASTSPSSWGSETTIDSLSSTYVQLGSDQILIMPYQILPLSASDKRNGSASGRVISFDVNGNYSIDKTSTPVQFLSFPSDLESYNVVDLNFSVLGDVLPLKTGALFTTGFGTFVGDSKYTLMSFTSLDNGLTWNFQSIVGNWRDISNPDAIDGPSEATTIRLADGRLMTIFRDAPASYFQTFSGDEGLHWTTPVQVADVIDVVQPRLLRLENGLILLLGGRPYLDLWICTDTLGLNWTRFDLAAHHNATVSNVDEQFPSDYLNSEKYYPPNTSWSTGYQSGVVLSNNEILIVYDRLANGWNLPPGPLGNADMVFSLRIKFS
jgi:hypothetical protein